MPRYTVALIYPNGSTSHELTTTNVHKARAWCASIFCNDDLREVASGLEVKYGKRVLFNAAPGSVPFGDHEGVIKWPESKAPRRYNNYRRTTISLPAALLEAARRHGSGNVSKGVLMLILEKYPELKDAALKY
jgi:hypothetical protein